MPASRGHKRRTTRSGSSPSSRARPSGRSEAAKNAPAFLKSHKRTIGLLLIFLALVGFAVYYWTLPIMKERALRAMSADQLQELTTSQPGNGRAFYYLGLRQRENGQLKEARDSFQQAAKDDLDDEQAWLALAGVYESLGSSNEAFTTLHAFSQAHPSSANAHKALSRFYSSHWAFDLAYNEALAASRLAPRDVDAWVLVGGRAMDMGHVPQAEAAFQKAVNLKPGNWQNLLDLGFALQTEKRNDEALTYFRKAYALAPNEPGTMLALGGMLISGSSPPADQQQALSLLQQAVSMNPSSPPGLRLLGQAYLQTGDYQKARDTLQKAAVASPDDATVHFQLQQAYSRLGDTADAAREAQKHKEIASFLVAREHLIDEMHVAPSDLNLGLRYARLCAAHNDYLDAVVEYRQLLAAHPESKEAQSELAGLQKRLPPNTEAQ